ncbi:maleylpyruvate isomerase family mycothiol-dependent enzyme [Nocardioides panacisoli]|uniref:Maleylpyruvate isomerase family mycothiol-dependent enzyme n=1 Tax=Nocardioides panacisoli TaxID=627624 RepID=A0ABP7IIV5_9ACTN
MELLERSLAYTRAALVTVGPQHLSLPTPCDHWRLGDLLAHMEDALDAFGEGAGGAIDLHSQAPAPLELRIISLQEKACALLGGWLAARSPYVDVAGHPVAVDTIARLAAVEITVHGWDVGRVTGHSVPVPDALAAELLPTAVALALDHPDGFGRPLPVPDTAGSGDRLLATLGRCP